MQAAYLHFFRNLIEVGEDAGAIGAAAQVGSQKWGRTNTNQRHARAL
ncbi:hypothetical protein JCM10914A_36760 [Paenibacillus sp. JCM 10914]|nr:hypothetical protein [Paenibacillus sp. JCM 10914]